MSEITQHKIKIDFPGLLQMLGTSIYSDPDSVCER